MMNFSIDLVAHHELTEVDLSRIERLFDSEYLDGFGAWNPEQPYGYAPHEVHILARAGDRILGHVGWAARHITVGDNAVTIGGLGGVLISADGRGHGLGAKLMSRAELSMRERGGIEFGYLGCREEIVPFYASCGWSRVHVGERSIGRQGAPVYDSPGSPILILPVAAPLESWPPGEVDLRGRAW